jgi:hypothetical protein
MTGKLSSKKKENFTLKIFFIHLQFSITFLLFTFPFIILLTNNFIVIAAHTMMFVTMEFVKEKMSLVLMMETNVTEMVIVTVRVDNVPIQINLTILHALTAMLVLMMIFACQEFALELQRHVLIPMHVKKLDFVIKCQALVNIQSKPMALDAQLTTVTFLNVG